MYPPFATFDVEVVNAVLSSLITPHCQLTKITPNALSPDEDSDSHRFEVQTLKALLIGIDINESTKEGDTARISIARKLALE